MQPRATDPEPWQRDLYYHFYENPGFHGVARHYGVRTARYKLVYYYQNDEWELFDLQTDPADQVNLYGKPGYDDITSDLKQRLQTAADAIPSARSRSAGALVPQRDGASGGAADDVVMRALRIYRRTRNSAQIETIARTGQISSRSKRIFASGVQTRTNHSHRA